MNCDWSFPQIATPSEVTGARISAIRKRELAAEMLHAGMAVGEVARQVGVSRQTMQRWKAIIATGDPTSLLTMPLRGRPQRLEGPLRAAAQGALRQGPDQHGQRTERWTLKGAAIVIERITGIEIGPTHVWRLLNELGLQTQHSHADLGVPKIAV